MAESAIEWTDVTWNPVTGCTRVSAGCDHCYAVRMSYRLEEMGQRQKYGGLTVLNGKGDRHFNGQIRTHEDVLTLPLKWRKPRHVFVNSMSDLFHRDVPFTFIDKVFAVMALTPHHTYQVLTKRPDRMAEYLLDSRCAMGFKTAERIAWLLAQVDRRELLAGRDGWGFHGTHPDQAAIELYERPLPNVWLGTSVENQQAADDRIPHLLKCPAAVRFLSCEPLLGPIEFSDVTKRPDAVQQLGKRALAGIDWVIAGGESGPGGARPMHPGWARSLRDQCVAAGVPFFFKQWGEHGATAVDMRTGQPTFRTFANKVQWINKACTWVNGGVCVGINGRAMRVGADFDDEAVYPVAITHRVGKAKAGRILDGRTWDEMPKPAGVANG